jgi:hypothetical protein
VACAVHIFDGHVCISHDEFPPPVAAKAFRVWYQAATDDRRDCQADAFAKVELLDLELLSEIDAALDAFRKQRLHPLVVEEILGITASERRRWTKDGRLPQSGMDSFGCGRQSIHFPLRPATKIAELARRPATIEAWRHEDEEQSSRKRFKMKSVRS